MTTAETFVTSMNTWLNDTSRTPLEVVLPRVLYLRLAADLGLDDPNAMLRPVYDPPSYSFKFPNAATREREMRRTVRVGPSFMLMEVLVREGAE